MVPLEAKLHSPVTQALGKQRQVLLHSSLASWLVEMTNSGFSERPWLQKEDEEPWQKTLGRDFCPPCTCRQAHTHSYMHIRVHTYTHSCTHMHTHCTQTKEREVEARVQCYRVWGGIHQGVTMLCKVMRSRKGPKWGRVMANEREEAGVGKKS